MTPFSNERGSSRLVRALEVASGVAPVLLVAASAGKGCLDGGFPTGGVGGEWIRLCAAGTLDLAGSDPCGRLWLALAASLLGLAVGAINCWLSHGRRVVYRWRRGSIQGFHWISGFPLIGTLAVVAGLVVGFGDWRCTVIGSAALAIDTCGLPWLALSALRARMPGGRP